MKRIYNFVLVLIALSLGSAISTFAQPSPAAVKTVEVKAAPQELAGRHNPKTAAPGPYASRDGARGVGDYMPVEMAGPRGALPGEDFAAASSAGACLARARR